MACYQCGSPSGTDFQMCRVCVQHGMKLRQDRLEKIGFAEGTAGHYSIFNDSWLQITGVAAISILVFWYIYAFGNSPATDPNKSLKSAACALCWCLTGLTWLTLWFRTASESTLKGVASFFLPLIVYTCLFGSWRQTRSVFAVHFIFLVASFVMTFDLAPVIDAKLAGLM